MSDDYGNEPVSLAAKRAEKAGDASMWTPRDALVNLIKQIDAGENVDAVVLIIRAKLPDGGTTIESRFAGNSSMYDTIGLMEMAKLQFYQQM